MPRLNSKKRAQASLLALVITTVLLNYAVAQFHFARATAKGANYHGQNQKDLLLSNGLHLVRLSGDPYEKTTEIEEEPLTYSWLQGNGSTIFLDQVSLGFDRHDHWPTLSGLWLQGEKFHLLITDFSHKGATP